MLYRILILYSLLSSLPLWANEIRTQYPSSLGVEVMGRSVIAGFVYDRMLSESWSVGAGFGYTAAKDGEKKIGDTPLFPVFLNYFWSSSFYATGGLTIVPRAGTVNTGNAGLGSLRFSARPFLLDGGLGYELRQANSFLFRAQLLLVYAKNLVVTPGLMLGYAF